MDLVRNSVLVGQEVILYIFLTVADSLHCMKISTLSEVYLISATFRELDLIPSSGNWLSLYWQIYDIDIDIISFSKVITCGLKTGTEAVPETSLNSV